MQLNIMPTKINIPEKFNLIDRYWDPAIITSLNGQDVLLAKIKGEFIWHQHDNEDEMFMVIKGTLKIEFEDKTVTLSPMECITIPKGVKHRPVADEEVHILLFEPSGTVNTGNVTEERTRKDLKRI